jgi:hypothetical protein
MDRVPINWSLASNPVNWIIILLMVYILGLAMSLLFHRQIGAQ